MSKTSPRPPDRLPAFDRESGHLHVIIETPKGSPNKFNDDEELGLFRLGGVLPAGSSFPFDFGFVPSTEGDDGDPLDVLLLMDAPAFTGCLVDTQLVGVIEAEQSEGGGMTRNDRLIGVAANSRRHKEVKWLDALPAQLLDEIEHFFRSYNDIKGKTLRGADPLRPRARPRAGGSWDETIEQRVTVSASASCGNAPTPGV